MDFKMVEKLIPGAKRHQFRRHINRNGKKGGFVHKKARITKSTFIGEDVIVYSPKAKIYSGAKIRGFFLIGPTEWWTNSKIGSYAMPSLLTDPWSIQVRDDDGEVWLTIGCEDKSLADWKCEWKEVFELHASILNVPKYKKELALVKETWPIVRAVVKQYKQILKLLDH